MTRYGFTAKPMLLLDFLQSLYFVHPGDLAQARDDLLEVLQVGNVEDDFNTSLAVGSLRGDVADVAFGVPDHSGNALQHAKPVVAKDGELHGIGGGSALVAGPLHIDAAFWFVEKIRHVRTVDRVHGHAFAARDVANDSLAADGIATSRSIDEHIALPAYRDGVVIAEDAAYNAGNASGLRRQAFGFDVACNRVRRASGQQTGQHLPRGIFSIPDARHEVVCFAQAVSGCDLLQIFVFDFLKCDTVFARFFFDQFASNFNRAFALVNIEPVLDLVARAGGLDQPQPISAGLVAGLREDFDNVSGMQLVTQRYHSSVYLGADTGVTYFGVNAVGKVDWRSVARQDNNFTFGREGVDLFGIEIDLERGKKFIGIANVALPLDHLPQPCEALLVLRRDWAVFVFPVGSDAFFRHLVHFFGADLDFKRRAVLRDHRSAQRLIKIRPGHGDEIFDAPRHRPPKVMDDAENGVAVLQRAGDDAHGA